MPTPKLSNKDFNRLSEFIQAECGIKIPPFKKTMLELRLHKRLRKLGFETFSGYYDYLFSPKGKKSEVDKLFDVVTTNKTDFFREEGHFQYLVQTVLPELTSLSGSGIQRQLRVWSAGCSTGEEPYTLAMILSEYAETCPGFHFSILATDISTDAITKAKIGIYEMNRVDLIPRTLKHKYLLRSKDKERERVRIAPIIRRLITFQKLNFMDKDFMLSKSMDIIFCRNVIIYFDRPTQETLMQRFCCYLESDGYIFMGHSETLHGMNVPLDLEAPTIYRKRP